jgi:hypothetical protein
MRRNNRGGRHVALPLRARKGKLVDRWVATPPCRTYLGSGSSLAMPAGLIHRGFTRAP